MSKDISPEEKLFNIIKSPTSFSGQHSLAQNAVQLSFPPLLMEIVERINFKLVNQILSTILCVVVLAVFYFVLGKKEDQSKVLLQSAANAAQPIQFAPIEKLPPVKTYLEEVDKRDIFHPATNSVAGSTMGGGQVNSKDFALSGIYVGKVSQAIIEDKAAQKVYFLNEGDEIKGYKVKSIRKDKVILQQGDDEIELL